MPAGASPGPGSAGEMRMTVLPPLEDAARVSCFLADQPRWSAALREHGSAALGERCYYVRRPD